MRKVESKKERASDLLNINSCGLFAVSSIATEYNSDMKYLPPFRSNCSPILAVASAASSANSRSQLATLALTCQTVRRAKSSPLRLASQPQKLTENGVDRSGGWRDPLNLSEIRVERKSWQARENDGKKASETGRKTELQANCRPICRSIGFHCIRIGRHRPLRRKRPRESGVR